ncbi:MAG: fused MFS/spermidine synthase [Verrucomicrobiales bacterium]
MPAFIFAIFLSAFLLFQVQPIIARYILPWYGGSPAVWTTCMLCFQVGLLAGYGYAHLLVSKFRDKPKTQVIIHLSLLAISFLLLPITPSEALKPTGSGNPIGGIVLLVATTVGLPYLAISASGPLLQSWFGLASGGKSPYRLYAISNLGSLLGLISYPFLFEPLLGLFQQTTAWSIGYGFYGLLAALCGWILWKKVPALEVKAAEKSDPPPLKRPLFSDRFLWVAFAACGSVALLAITNQMCQDVAVIPFLWVLPLSLYLTTFIIAFDASRWYWRPFWIPAMIIAVGGLVWLINQDYADGEVHLIFQIGIYCAALFTCCMVCHGEMVRLKPDPHYLTAFYLAVALGGAIGGLFVSFVAPAIFNAYHELHFILLLIFSLLAWVLFRSKKSTNEPRETHLGFLPGWIIVMLLLAGGLAKHVIIQKEGTINSRRGFYGVLTVGEGGVAEDSEADHYKQLYHGRISHGRQFMDEPWIDWPITYYTKGSGPDTVFKFHPARAKPPTEPMKFGFVGLGVGTMAAFAEKGDTVRVYEINPQVEDIAREHFFYLDHTEKRTGKAPEVVLGDARIMLEQEFANDDIQNYDALFVDAFSGDSVPIHLLTEEAFMLYFKHLKPDGVLGIHITNLHLDLSDPVRVLAEKFGHEAHLVVEDSGDFHTNYSEWVLISKNQEFLTNAMVAGLFYEWNREEPKPILWTDDYSNLAQVVMWGEIGDALKKIFSWDKASAE